jgi:hypothetical protein
LRRIFFPFYSEIVTFAIKNKFFGAKQLQHQLSSHSGLILPYLNHINKNALCSTMGQGVDERNSQRRTSLKLIKDKHHEHQL